MPTQQEEMEKLEDYFYRYFSIPQYDNIDPTIRLSKQDFFNKLISLAVAQREKEIVEKLKYDLFPVQIREENPNYWNGYKDTREKIINLITKPNDKQNN